MALTCVMALLASWHYLRHGSAVPQGLGRLLPSGLSPSRSEGSSVFCPTKMFRCLAPGFGWRSHGNLRNTAEPCYEYCALFILHIFFESVFSRLVSLSRFQPGVTTIGRGSTSAPGFRPLATVPTFTAVKPGGLTHPLPGSKAPVTITEKRKRPGGPTHVRL
jgi:hypothetical protein